MVMKERSGGVGSPLNWINSARLVRGLHVGAVLSLVVAATSTTLPEFFNITPGPNASPILTFTGFVVALTCGEFVAFAILRARGSWLPAISGWTWLVAVVWAGSVLALVGLNSGRFTTLKGAYESAGHYYAVTVGGDQPITRAQYFNEGAAELRSEALLILPLSVTILLSPTLLQRAWRD